MGAIKRGILVIIIFVLCNEFFIWYANRFKLSAKLIKSNVRINQLKGSIMFGFFLFLPIFLLIVLIICYV